MIKSDISRPDPRTPDSRTLPVENEWWTLYYDRVYDAGYIGPTHSGVGLWAMLWLPDQTEKAGFAVGNYGIETVLDLQPTRRDFRFAFFDYAGQKNEAARVDLQGRARALQQELATFVFTDASLAHWPPPQKQAEIQRVLAAVPEEKKAAARYERWSHELATQLKQVRSGAGGAIMAEANVARIIGDWERRLPELKLKALLNEI
ncbi:MAG: hypothetical protein FJW35_16225 [Acidobacteria bacterium]|nr:hypothetical protein [Acidobacteriota bacterium]